VDEVAKAAGITGRVSMRTLRHTYLTQLARKALDPAVVVQLGNVSPREAIRYTKGAAMDRDVEVFERMREGA
jgi:integrase